MSNTTYQILNSFPDSFKKDLYTSLNENKKLYREFKEILSSDETLKGNYEKLSTILKKIINNHVLHNYLYTNEPLYQKSFNSHFLDAKPNEDLEVYEKFAKSLMNEIFTFAKKSLSQ